MQRLLKTLVAVTGVSFTLASVGCGAVPPTPGSGPVSGLAPVEEVNLLMLESFPVQVVAVVKGTLPDTCTKVDQITQNREGNTFKVKITTHSDQGESCPATGLQNHFEQNVPLDVYGLSKGTYTVDVNGVSQTFELTADNVPSPSSGPVQPAPVTEQPGGQPTVPPGEPPGGQPPTEVPGGNPNILIRLAQITGAEVALTSTAPPAVEVTMHGYLGDGCTKLAGISEELSGSTIRLTVQTQRPKDAICSMIAREFTQKYTLKTPLSRGTYTLAINDFTTQVTIP